MTNSTDIKKLLAKKHSEDVFVEECKNGPSGKGLLIMDAWAMRKSWSKPCCTGYEIKVSRSDFLNDDKWMSYLSYCNKFYFVCPPKLISPDELPQGVGLYYVSSTGNMLYNKRKAVFREVAIPESIFRYLLMNRINNSGGNDRNYWDNWLKEESENQKLSYMISRRISKIIEDTRSENSRLKTKIASYDDYIEVFKRFNIDTSRYDWNFERKIKEIVGGLPEGFENKLESLINDLSKMQELIK